MHANYSYASLCLCLHLEQTQGVSSLSLTRSVAEPFQPRTTSALHVSDRSRTACDNAYYGDNRSGSAGFALRLWFLPLCGCPQAF